MTESSQPGGLGPGQIAALADRAVQQLTNLARRASRYATQLLLVVTVVCAGGFLLGWAAFDGHRVGWSLIGGFFGAWAIGAALVGRWRIGSIKRHVPELLSEIRTLLTDGRQAGAEVIETFVVDDGDGNEHFSAQVDNSGMFGLGRAMWSYKGLVGTGTQSFARLGSTVSAITSYPLLAVISIAISFVYLGLSAIFAIVLLF